MWVNLDVLRHLHLSYQLYFSSVSLSAQRLEEICLNREAGITKDRSFNSGNF